jgi:HlyD family secretion protein
MSGSLDHKAVEEVLVAARLELEQSLNEFEDAKMDSNLNLSNSRDQIVNAREQVEQMQIILEESRYESPAVIRKAEMDLEKAKTHIRAGNKRLCPQATTVFYPGKPLTG